jgi:hypothetical protein
MSARARRICEAGFSACFRLDPYRIRSLIRSRKDLTAARAWPTAGMEAARHRIGSIGVR